MADTPDWHAIADQYARDLLKCQARCQALSSVLEHLRPVARAALALNDGLEGENALYESLARDLAVVIDNLPNEVNLWLRAD